MPLGAGAGGRIGNLQFLNSFDLDIYRSHVENHRAYNLEGNIASALYNYAYGMIGEIQFGKLKVKPSACLKDNGFSLHEFAESLVEAGLAVKDSREGYKLTRDGVYWGNNIGNQLAVMLTQNISKDL